MDMTAKSMERRIKQRHLLCFLEIVRSGSIVRAAEQLGITQSGASRTLGELEEIIQARLLERNRAGVALTPLGEIFFRHVSASATALSQGLEKIAMVRQDSRQSVFVGVLPNATERVLPAAVLQFKKRHPGIPVSVVTGTNTALMQSLRVGNLDFVIGRLAAPADMSGIDFRSLYNEYLTVAARPGHPFLDPELPRSLADFTFVMPVEGSIIRRDAEQVLIKAGITSMVDYVETVSTAFGRAFVLSSDAIWIAPWGAVAKDLKTGVLVQLPVDASATSGTVGISTRSQAGLTPLAKDLVQIISELALDIAQKNHTERDKQL